MNQPHLGAGSSPRPLAQGGGARGAARATALLHADEVQGGEGVHQRDVEARGGWGSGGDWGTHCIPVTSTTQLSKEESVIRFLPLGGGERALRIASPMFGAG